MAGKPGTFLILSFLPSLLVAPHSAQGWNLKNYNFAELADKKNTGKCKQKPLLFCSVCGTFHTDATRETITTGGSAAQAGPPRVPRSCGPPSLPPWGAGLARGRSRLRRGSLGRGEGLAAVAPHAPLRWRLCGRPGGSFPLPRLRGVFPAAAAAPRVIRGAGGRARVSSPRG